MGANNIIESISDGNRNAVLLSDIPQSAAHFNQIRTHLHLSTDTPIELHTWNRRFEQWFAWLGTALKKDSHISKHYQYSTTDMMAPSQIDLIRFVDNVRKRNDPACNHCKSGKGRSATGMVAYVLYAYHIGKKVNLDGTLYTEPAIDAHTIVDSAVSFVTKKRSIVDLNPAQLQAAFIFNTNLKQAVSFDALLAEHATAIAQRNAEFSK